MSLPFQLRYGIIDHSEFSDYVLVDNPHYGPRQFNTPTGVKGSRYVFPDANRWKVLEERGNFFSKLEKDILERGFLNPCFAFQFKNGLFAKIGTSRLWVAKKHKLELPTIIADYIGRWTDFELLDSLEKIESKYHSPPKIIDINPDLPVIQYQIHHHLPKKYWRQDWLEMEEVRIWNEESSNSQQHS